MDEFKIISSIVNAKPQINADERRYVDRVEVYSFSLSKLVIKSEGWYVC
ncbi:MAG: hypothetical protein O8C62_08355 [Candidatus Methanoperedens sp.]|nr:hypothetical protein [Candidatus Methanoperedens sp.]